MASRAGWANVTLAPRRATATTSAALTPVEPSATSFAVISINR
jgi:hypothetical protein